LMTRVRKSVLWFLTVVLLVALAAGAGCGRASAPDTSEPAAQGETRDTTQAAGADDAVEAPETDESHEEPFPLTITDGLGRDVTLEERPERIVCLAPSNAEIVYALGGGQGVVGVADSCDYPEAVAELSHVGGCYDAKHTNFEAIVALEPDLVLGINGHPEVLDRLEELGVCAFAVDAKVVDEVLESIDTVGRLIGRRAEAAELIAGLRDRIDAVVDEVAGLPAPRVFFEVWYDPLMTAGPGSFQHDLIELAGGENVAGDADQPWPTFSLEVLVERDPEVIITTFGETVTALESGTREGWRELSAVRNGRVVLVDPNLVSRPGPRIVDGLELFARAIHPQAFAGQ